MEVESKPKRDRILQAATECFSRYGFKRTAMDDIAQAAGISRASLYLLFQNKENIFRTLSEQLYGNAIRRAEAAFQTQGTFRARLIAAFEGKDLELCELVKTSPHGNELVDFNHVIASDIIQAAEQRFEALLTQAIEQADRQGEIVLSRLDFDAERCAILLIGCTQGLKKSASSAAEYQQRLGQLVSIFSQAL